MTTYPGRTICRGCDKVSLDLHYAGEPDWLMLVSTLKPPVEDGFVHERYKCKSVSCGTAWTRTSSPDGTSVEWQLYTQA
jgi:hypothetical protein